MKPLLIFILTLAACITWAYGCDYVIAIEGSVVYVLLMDCCLTPMWEELCYRYGPIEIARKINQRMVWPVVVVSSYFFGWGHGYGEYSLLLHGSLGVVFSWMYIKEGFWMAFLLHAWYNTIISMLG